MPEPSSSHEMQELLARVLAENARLSEENGQVRTENKLLREKIDTLLRKLFGASSEKLDAGQLLLMLQGLDAPPGKDPEPVGAEVPRRSTGQSPPRERGPRWPEHLPVVEEVIDPEPVKACREAWRCIGEEVTEQLDFKPAEFFKRRLIRRKYVRCEQPFVAPVIAPLRTLQDRCLAAPGLGERPTTRSPRHSIDLGALSALTSMIPNQNPRAGLSIGALAVACRITK